MKLLIAAIALVSMFPPWSPASLLVLLPETGITPIVPPVANRSSIISTF